MGNGVSIHVFPGTGNGSVYRGKVEGEKIWKVLIFGKGGIFGGGELNDFRGICLETIVAGILLVFFAL